MYIGIKNLTKLRFKTWYEDYIRFFYELRYVSQSKSQQDDEPKNMN